VGVELDAEVTVKVYDAIAPTSGLLCGPVSPDADMSLDRERMDRCASGGEVAERRRVWPASSRGGPCAFDRIELVEHAADRKRVAEAIRGGHRDRAARLALVRRQGVDRREDGLLSGRAVTPPTMPVVPPAAMIVLVMGFIPSERVPAGTVLGTVVAFVAPSMNREGRRRRSKRRSCC
jgi:hypothetical protein